MMYIKLFYKIFKCIIQIKIKKKKFQMNLKEFSLLSDNDLINRFNCHFLLTLEKKIFIWRNNEYLYERRFYRELNNRFDISDIGNDSKISFKKPNNDFK